MTSTAPLVLCVEDEPHLLNDLQEELVAAGYQVCQAASVAQAQDVLRNTSPDLVLSDIMLGSDDQPDGYHLHEHIRNKRPDLAAIPFIFLTALGQRSDLLLAKKLGVDDYLVKPVDYDLLLATIATRLASVHRVQDAQNNSSQHPLLLDQMRKIFAQLPSAVLLCNGEGLLLYANFKAQSLMQEHNLWRVNSQGKLKWPKALPASLKLLQHNMTSMLTANTGEHRVQCLEMSFSSDNILLSLLKLNGITGAPVDQHVFALFICSAQSRPVPDSKTLRLLFSLTPSEAKVASLLALGHRPESIASELHISAATVNFHLRNLFQKMGVTRQSDLIAQVLAAGWALPDLSGSV